MIRPDPRLVQRVALIVVAIGWAAFPSSSAEDWPHRRGPTRDGVTSQHSGWDGERWEIQGPIWSGSFGAGASAPLAVDSRVYVMGWKDGRDRLHAVDASSGETVWTASYAAPQYGRFSEGDKGLYAGPSSTPEYDQETAYLYTLGLDGELNCWDTAEGGRRVWGFNLYERFKAPQRPKVGRSGLRDYGYTSSPLALGRGLIVEVGSPRGNLIAFDKRTGELLWASENDDPAGHSAGPVPLTVEDVPCVAVMTHRGLLVVRVDAPHAGQTVAEYPWETSFANNVVAPAVDGNRVLVTSAYNHNSMHMLEISLKGATKLWEQPYASKVCTPVIHDGHVYWSWQKLHCLDLATGEQRWAGGSFGDAGSLVVTADGRLIVWGDRGRLALAEGAQRSPRAYRPLAERKELSRTDAWPHLALARGRLFLKDRAGDLQCFQIAADPD